MEYRLQVDEQGRILLPEEMREQLGYGPLLVYTVEHLIVIKKEVPEKTFTWTPQK
ncbi:hypothetical protein [Aneurinibacillus uraniidurans]|uniref:hypothetical protein n=1 Tax=Aneurinibacillus uraniidurans TaxID=2966586 RepID=UPI00234BD3ED|nr:hypothetical protein [Aneurinibacillus sp. B1]WCN36767.1 hypothetical protein PO771_12925 [Aneurinibacillus sp. B1]